MKRPGIYFSVALLFLLCGLCAEQESPAAVMPRHVTIAMVMEVGSLSQMEVEEAFEYGLPEQLQKTTDVHKIYIAKSDAHIQQSQIGKLKHADIVIAIGTNASKLLSQTQIDTPVLNIFLPRTAYRLHWEGSGKRASAIFLEQPPERYARLAKSLLPDIKRVSGFMEYDRVVVNMFKTSFAEQNMVFNAYDLSADEFIKNLKSSLNNTDLLLIPAGHPALTSHRAKWLLYMAYRKHIPVIAFSGQFSDAGALASIYSMPAQIGKQAAELVIKMISTRESSTNRLPTTVYPEYFMVNTNKKVEQAYLHKNVNEIELKNTLGYRNRTDGKEID